MTEHWIDTAKREGKPLSRGENRIRISAEDFVKLQTHKNKARGTKRSLYEENKAFERKQANKKKEDHANNVETT